MKTKQTVIAVCITALFASGAVMAKEKWEYNEDKWDDTRSYGRVTIDKDSVSAWGPWEDFVEPAAGAPSVAFAGAGAGDPYRPITPIPPIPIPAGCGDGEWCGYMALAIDYKKSKNKCYPSFLDRFEPAEIALQFEQPDSKYFDWLGKGGVNLVLRSDLPDYGSAGMETGMVPVWFFGKQGWFDGHAHDPYISLEGGFDGYNWYTRSWVNKYATMGILEAKIQEYISFNGDGGEGGSVTRTVYAPFVAGQLTPLADMASLSAGDVQARYKGETALAGGKVDMTVNFKPATWSGTFNGGSGPTGFTVGIGTTVQGSVSGTNFAASGSSIGSYDKHTTTTGTVNGSFYGPQAAAAGGVVDITKTASYIPNGDAKISILEPTRYVDVFLANKVSQQVPKPAPIVQ